MLGHLPEDLVQYVASFLTVEDQLQMAWCGFTEVTPMAYHARSKKLNEMHPFHTIHTPITCMHPLCKDHRLFLFDLTDEDGPAYVMALSWYCTTHIGNA